MKTTKHYKSHTGHAEPLIGWEDWEMKNNNAKIEQLVDKVKGKLSIHNIDVNDCKESIECLSHCVNSALCIKIYNAYINPRG